MTVLQANLNEIYLSKRLESPAGPVSFLHESIIEDLWEVPIPVFQDIVACLLKHVLKRLPFQRRWSCAHPLNVEAIYAESDGFDASTCPRDIERLCRT